MGNREREKCCIQFDIACIIECYYFYKERISSQQLTIECLRLKQNKAFAVLDKSLSSMQCRFSKLHRKRTFRTLNSIALK